MDGCGHGTHVAGIIGGTTYGVAKNVTLIAVKILNRKCEGTIDTLLAGIDYVVQQKKLRPAVPIVLNLSITGPIDQLEINAINTAVRTGIPVVVAAGNSYGDACKYAPSCVRSAITVGSTALNNDKTKDIMSDFSNGGTCVDILAPGTDIRSAFNGNDYDTATLDGTSMAAPHVTAVIAMYLQKSPRLTPARIWKKISSIATVGVVTTLRNTPNLFLLTQNISSTTTTTKVTPVTSPVSIKLPLPAPVPRKSRLPQPSSV